LQLAQVVHESLAESRAIVHENWPTEFAPLPIAGDCVSATLTSILATKVAEDTDWNNSEVHRALIQTAVFQGIHAVEDCIKGGLYVQAAPLIRQEMEAVEALREIRQGRRVPGKTPKLKALKQQGRFYSRLTELAHFGKDDLLSYLLRDGSSVSLDPRFNRDFARFLFAMHVHALIGVVLDMADLYKKVRGFDLLEIERAHLETALGMLGAEGIVR
jgi:hypothetical protein